MRQHSAEFYCVESSEAEVVADKCDQIATIVKTGRKPSREKDNSRLSVFLKRNKENKDPNDAV